MWKAASSATFQDDVLGEDVTTNSLQAEIARLTGHEAGLFVLSATMANQLAMRALLLQPPYSVIVDSRSHILHYEAGGVSNLTGATMQIVDPRNKKYLTLEDIKAKVVLESDYIQFSPTKVICLENTCNGLVMPLEEIRRISVFARENDIKLHLDGTRIFDAVITGAGTLEDFCREFDTVSLCFSKTLGAPIGGGLVGNKALVSRARKVRQSIGGGVHQSGFLAAMARVALKENFGEHTDGKGSHLARCHRNAKRVEQLWLQSGGKLLGPTETCMVFIDIEDARLSTAELTKMSYEHGVKIKNQRVVIHYRRSSLSAVHRYLE
jgi:threonine aldolase